MERKRSWKTRFGCIAIAAALAVPAVAHGEASNPTLQNDVAHFGNSTPAGRPSATALNDRAHFGGSARLSTPSPALATTSAPLVVRIDEGFDWVSAAVGAAGGIGLLLVAAAGTSVLRRRNGANVAQV